MDKITANTRVLCCCANGQVRSIACRRALFLLTGNRRTLTCGLERNDEATVVPLVLWSDVIVVCGSHNMFDRLPSPRGWPRGSLRTKTLCAYVGPDVWHNPFGNDLVERMARLLWPLVEPLPGLTFDGIGKLCRDADPLLRTRSVSEYADYGAPIWWPRSLPVQAGF